MPPSEQMVCVCFSLPLPHSFPILRSPPPGVSSARSSPDLNARRIRPVCILFTPHLRRCPSQQPTIRSCALHPCLRPGPMAPSRCGSAHPCGVNLLSPPPGQGTPAAPCPQAVNWTLTATGSPSLNWPSLARLRQPTAGPLHHFQTVPGSVPLKLKSPVEGGSPRPLLWVCRLGSEGEPTPTSHGTAVC